MKQNPDQSDVSDLPNAEMLIRAGEKFTDLHDNQTIVSSQVGVDSTLTASCCQVCVVSGIHCPYFLGRPILAW